MPVSFVRQSRALQHVSLARLIVALAILMVGRVPAVPAQAVPPDGDQQRGPLLLQDAYDVATRANPRTQAARWLARAARARIPAAKLPPDPQVQLGLMNYGLPGLKPMDPLGMAQLQLMQMLPVGGKLGLSGDVAEARAAAEAERSSDVAWDVRSQVAMAFYDLYATDQSLVVARETLRLLQDVRASTDAMYRVGEGRQTDVLRAQVEIARMTADTTRMRAMRMGMAARLNALLDRPDASPVSSPALPSFPASVPALDSLQHAARDNRSMVRAGHEDVQAAYASARLARRELIPDLQLGFQYGQRSGEMGLERMGSLMVGATIPVFARSRQLRMREETIAMREMAEADLAAMRADTRARVAEAHASLTRARHLATLYRNTVLPQAEAMASSALAAYRVGGVDFMTLLDGRMIVNEYRQELFRLEADEGRSWADLEMLLGRQLFDANSVVAGVRTNGGVR
jgi:cobalt-zinc-cadmium efflux system outer membrane protein